MTESEDVTIAVVTREFKRRRRFQRLRRWRPLILVVLAALLVGFGVWSIFFSSWVTVRQVEVSGNTTLVAARIERIAAAPIGRPLARVDLAAIQARVEALPAVESAAVSRSWPHTVHVEVVERTPVAVVNRGSGLQAVDESGVLFGSYAVKPADLPLVITEPDVKAEALAEAAEVLRSLRADIAARVRFVDVKTVDRIELRMADGRRVTWGSADDSAAKAEVLAVLLQQKDVDVIDVSVPDRPTTK